MTEEPVVTFDELVADSGLDEKQVGTYIRGQGNPTYSTLLKLCAGLHVNLPKLMRRAEDLHEERYGR